MIPEENESGDSTGPVGCCCCCCCCCGLVKDCFCGDLADLSLLVYALDLFFVLKANNIPLLLLLLLTVYFTSVAALIR